MISSRVYTCRQENALLLSLMLLLVQLHAPGWQASGNMTDYLPTIRGFMDAALQDNLDRTVIAANISTECNTLWDEYWSVFVVWLRSPSSDVVLYGYAFRRHWYWHNNYLSTSQSFVIWKDYNVGEFNTNSNFIFDETAEGAQSVALAMQDTYDDDNSVSSDVWKWVHDAIENYLHSYLSGQYSTTLEKVAVSAVMVNEIPQQISMMYRYAGYNYFRKDTTPVPYMIQMFVTRHDE